MHQDKPNVWMKMTHVHKEKKNSQKTNNGKLTKKICVI